MPPLEHEIQSQIINHFSRISRKEGKCQILRLQSGLSFGAHGGKVALCPPGTPDLLLILPDGKSLFIEVKSERGKLTPSQKEMHATLELLGHRVIVARSVGDVLEVLQSCPF